ncbi:MAG: ABC transporter permease subunit [Saccharothrix sp.]|nr:ABC transporter permease subunit [Saccharothrix sp.]
MIWLAWRQQRLTVFTTFGAVAVVMAGMLILRLTGMSYMDEHGITGCTVPGPGCDSTAMNMFAEAFRGLWLPLILIMFALPPLVGAFTGGPLFAREIERGTHVFALTQSIGRTRWWAVKTIVGLVPVLAAMALLGLVATWSLAPLAYVTTSPIRTPGFETQGLVVAAYTLLAFAIGSVAGLLLRNTLGAMVLAIAFYIALLVPVGSFLRPAYAEPTKVTVSVADMLEQEAPDVDGWQVAYGYLDAAGNEVDFAVTPDCGPPDKCMADQGIVALYTLGHPATRFWRFQFTESALFTGIAALVIAAGSAAVRRVRT